MKTSLILLVSCEEGRRGEASNRPINDDAPAETRNGGQLPGGQDNPMPITSIVTLAIVLQLIAASMALKLIALTGRRLAWGLISATLLLMALKRSYSLGRILSGDAMVGFDYHIEMMDFAISLLMVVGISRIAPIFNEKKDAEEALKKSENRYRELSIVDGLTGLFNTRYFYHQIRMEMDRANRYGHPLTMLLIDLDDFKQFNDAYGHLEGDQVLLQFGNVVRRCLRQTDTAYRYGGEEFTILLPMTTHGDGSVIAERIRTEFKLEHFSPTPGDDVHLTVSIGLAQYSGQEEIKSFVHRADRLMYQAKKIGKDRICCDS
jgi:diguanylate cyclase (GGDEF)-like protein